MKGSREDNPSLSRPTDMTRAALPVLAAVSLGLTALPQAQSPLFEAAQRWYHLIVLRDDR